MRPGRWPLVNAASPWSSSTCVDGRLARLWTVGVVVGVLLLALRATHALRERTESLEQLGRFTGELGGQLDVDALPRRPRLDQRCCEADVVELTLAEDFAGRHAGAGHAARRSAADGVAGPGWRCADAWLHAGPLRASARPATGHCRPPA